MVVADGGIRLGLGLPEHHVGPLEDREGHAVGFHDGIQDHDIHGLLVGETDQPQILRVDPLCASSHFLAKGLEGSGAVDPVVCRGEGDPGGIGGLGAGRSLEQGGQERETGQEAVAVHDPSLPDRAPLSEA